MTADPVHPLRFPRTRPKLSARQKIRLLARNWIPLIPPELFSKPIITRRTWFYGVHLVADPALIREILRDIDTYQRPRLIKRIFEPITDDSLLFANQEHWVRLNGLSADAFSGKCVRAGAGPMIERAAEASMRLGDLPGECPKVLGEMSRLVQEAMTGFVFSDPEILDKSIVDGAISAFSDITSTKDLIRLSRWAPRRWRIDQRPAVQRFKARVDELVRAHPSDASNTSGTAPTDALGRLLSGGGEALSNDQLRGAVLTYYYAGRKTTALAMAWALYLLACHPDAQDRVRAEAEALGDDPVGVHAKLRYTGAVVDEALRMYPPLASMPRQAARATSLAGTEIRRGDQVMVPLYVLHRHENLWDAPNEFRPERFLEKGTYAAFSYLPFGGGARLCPGASFATQLATVAVARFVRDYEFALPEDWTPSLVFMMTLRVKGGIQLRIRPVR